MNSDSFTSKINDLIEKIVPIAIYYISAIVGTVLIFLAIIPAGIFVGIINTYSVIKKTISDFDNEFIW